MGLKYEPASEPLHISVEWLRVGTFLRLDVLVSDRLVSCLGRAAIQREMHLV